MNVGKEKFIIQNGEGLTLKQERKNLGSVMG